MSDDADDGSSATVEQHKAALVAEARAIHRAHPERRFVGLIVEADAPEAPGLRQALPRNLREPEGSFWVMLTRESALELLSAATPDLLDWLDDEGEVSMRRLPVIHAARRGMRTVSFEYAVDG